jgi:hypothetical protein
MAPLIGTIKKWCSSTYVDREFYHHFAVNRILPYDKHPNEKLSPFSIKILLDEPKTRKMGVNNNINFQNIDINDYHIIGEDLLLMGS